MYNTRRIFDLCVAGFLFPPVFLSLILFMSVFFFLLPSFTTGANDGQRRAPMTRYYSGVAPHWTFYIIYLFIYLNIFIQGRTFSVYTVLQCGPVNAIRTKHRYIMQVIL